MISVAPEAVGIASADVRRFYERLEEHGLSTHGVLLARGDRIFSEAYYAPFTEKTKHRMYSVSKTFVGAAVLLCIQDGLLTLQTPIAGFFPNYPPERTGDTVESLLCMETTMEDRGWWFESGCCDRTDTCFCKDPQKLPMTQFDYDSQGSYLLGVIVERLTGKPFLTFLQERVLNEIGFSRDAYCLRVPGGHSFADSGVMCTPRDLLLFARLLMNGGSMNGKQYLRRDLVERMTEPRVCTNDLGFRTSGSYGYGWQIWGAPRGGFAMFGMGGQFALCLPKRDLIFVITSDDQGNAVFREQIFDAFYDRIDDRLSDEPLCECPEAVADLREYERSRRLFALSGPAKRDLLEQIDGKRYVCRENPMGIRWFRLSFADTVGTLDYENGRGKHRFSFGLGYNLFAPFPDEDAQTEVATVRAVGKRYRAAFSADLPEERKLRIRVQIIDEYLGNLAMVFGFSENGCATVRMCKSAEAFLDGYQGSLIAEPEA